MRETELLLDQLLTVTRALERGLADPGWQPDLRLLEVRARLVDRLRDLLEASGPRPGRDLILAARELQEADRELRRTAAVRVKALGQAIADLSWQRTAVRSYLGGSGGGQGSAYRLTRVAR